MPSVEELSRAYWKAEEAHDLDGVMRFYHPDAVFEAPGVALHGAEIRKFYAESFHVFPKLKVDVLRVMGNEKAACLEWRITMTDLAGVDHVQQGVNLVETDGERFLSVRAYFDRKALDIAGQAKL